MPRWSDDGSGTNLPGTVTLTHNRRPMPGRPAKLYKYQPYSVQSLSNLARREVWFSRPGSFNDPFDSALKIALDELSEQDMRRILDYLRKDVGEFAEEAGIAEGYLDSDGTPNERFRDMLQRIGHDVFNLDLQRRGVACFSERCDDLLLWSHYGNGHRGFCLEFSTDCDLFTKTHRVRYSDQMPRGNIADALINADEAFWLGMILTKAPCWSYEKEWRVIHVEPDHAYCYDWKALAGLYFGSKMEETHKSIIGMILRGSPTKFFQMSHVPDAFRLEAEAVVFRPPVYDDIP